MMTNSSNLSRRDFLRRDRLLQRMLDPGQFNWGKLPLTSLAMTEADYVEATGRYDGRAWWGDVWTLRNAMVVKGLEESGRPELAAELNWSTIKAFHRNYTEFVVPSTGEGHGVKRYGWSASEYIAAIVEHLFGVDFDRIQNRVRIMPHVPPALYGKDIALDDLILSTGGGHKIVCPDKPVRRRRGQNHRKYRRAAARRNFASRTTRRRERNHCPRQTIPHHRVPLELLNP